MSKPRPFTQSERWQLADNAEQGVSPTPGDVHRYEASFSMVDHALDEFHEELDYLSCAQDGVSYASSAAPGNCACALCSLHRISDQLIAALGQSVST